MPESKILLFGDSIAAGLGVRGQRYIDLTAAALGMKIIDLSGTGQTVDQSLERYRRNPHVADYAIVAHGITEPIIRPTPAALRWLPGRWQRRGWMDPRPYFSRRRLRRIPEKIESACRWRLKNVILRKADWGHQVLDIESYIQSLGALLELLHKHKIHSIILEPPHISERYFPGSTQEQARYFEAASALGETLTVRGSLEPWTDYFLDQFHPNHTGHEKIAELLVKRLGSAASVPVKRDHYE